MAAYLTCYLSYKLYYEKGVRLMKVTEFAATMLVKPSIVRYYLHRNLLKPAIKENGYHDFKPQDQRDLTLILGLKQLGFTIKEIQFLLELDHGEATLSCNQETVKFLKQKIVEFKTQSLSLKKAVGVLQDVENLVIKKQEVNNEDISKYLGRLTGGN